MVTPMRNDILNLKKLGTLQEKVLFFLAENPENHKQAIQKGINHPDDQYSSILHAVNALLKIGFIESKKAISQKKQEIKVYSCTELGLLYTLAENRSLDVPKFLNTCQTKGEIWKTLKDFYNDVGQEQFLILFRQMADILPMIKKDGLENAMIYLFLRTAKQVQKIDSKTRMSVAKSAMQNFPTLKPAMKEWAKNIKQITE
jgi:DNA-binding PadR family transcriptional regulator